MSCTVYGLKLRHGSVRYIGQTCKSVDRRLVEHVCFARRGGVLPLHRWLRKHEGDVIVVVLVADAVRNEDEIRLIKQYRASGSKLLNVTDGGDGIAGFSHSEATKIKTSLSLRGRVITSEWKAKISAGLTGRVISPEVRARMSAGQQRRVAREQR